MTLFLLNFRISELKSTGPPTMAEHCIDNGDHPPIAVSPYRLPPAKKRVLRAEIDKMQRDGVIKDCESPWGTLTVLVSEKDDSTRVYDDYRQLYLRSGYHQVPIREENRDSSA